MTPEELAARIQRLEEENLKLFTRFAGCSQRLKAALYENGVLQSERDELQYQIEQLNQANAA